MIGEYWNISNMKWSSVYNQLRQWAKWLDFMKFGLNNVTLIKYLYVLFHENLRVALQCFFKDSNTLLWQCTVMHRKNGSAFGICTPFSVCRSPNSPSCETPFFLCTEHCTLILAVVTGCLVSYRKFVRCVFHYLWLETTFKKLQKIRDA